MIKKIIYIFGIIFILLIAGAGYFAYKTYINPDISGYENLKEPQISTKEDQKVITYSAEGDPDTVAGEGIAKLYQVYFSIPEVDKTSLVPPRGRWEFITEGDSSNLRGELALPVPDSVESVSDDNIEVKTWEYGKVAEILHVGPYDKEEPTIEKLMNFIDEMGYETVGRQEEEYLRGPTFIGEGNPDEYATIIRYRIQEKTESVESADVESEE